MSKPGKRLIGDSGLAELFGSEGLELEEAGEISTDRFGLSTGTCVYRAPKDRVEQLVAESLLIGQATHPYASYLTLEKRRIIFTPGLASVVCEFSGCFAESDWQYEFESGVKEQPIQSHPNFIVWAKKYGIFRQLTGPSAGMEFQPAPYYKYNMFNFAEFQRFSSMSPLAGIDSFIDFANGIWRATRTTNTRPTSLLGEIGTIMTPPGTPPSFTDTRPYYYIQTPVKARTSGGIIYDYHRARLASRTIGSRDWLYMGLNYTQRGGAFVETHQWLLSGPGGWNTNLYQESNFDFDEEDGFEDYPESVPA